MSDIAIQVEKLSKKYKIGAARYRHDSIRDHLAEWAKSLFIRNGQPSDLSSQPSTFNPQLSTLNSPPSDTIWALKEVSFEVKHGEIMGIIGPNGAGKSTLLKILSRITEPTSGFADIHGRVGSLLEVGTGFNRDLTGRENIYLNGAIMGMKKAEIDRKFDEIVDFSGVEKFIDTPVKRYSSGMYVRLAFAVAAHLELEILIVDEVLAVGDAAFQKKCLGKMGDAAREGRTVLFVSHNMAAARNFCSQIVLLKEGRIQLSGAAADVVREYVAMVEDSQTRYPLLDERPDRSGSGNVRIVSFQARARDSKGGPPRMGAGAEFLVGYAARREQRISRLYVSIGVTDVLGNGVCVLSTGMTNSDFYGIPPRGQIVCQIDWLPLIPGKYQVHIKLVDDHEKADNVKFAASFNVMDGSNCGFSYPRGDSSDGSVIVPHTWLLSSPAEQNQ